MLRCAVIGCGWAGNQHIKSIIESSYSQLAAVVEPDTARADITLKTFGVPVFSSLDALLSTKVEFEVGIVATLPGLHYEQCIALANAGKHILCEKPVCRNSKDIEALALVANETGVCFGVVFNQRYGHAVEQAKILLKDDNTSIHLITASMYQHLQAWIGNHVDENMLITDSCCHMLDLVTFFGGPIKSVKGLAKKVDSDIYSDIASLLEFESGGVGIMSHTGVGGKLDTQHPFQCLDIHTGKARYRIENQFDSLIVFPHDGEARLIYETSVFRARDYTVSLRNACDAYYRALYEGGEPPVGINDALTNMRCLEAIMQSVTDQADNRVITTDIYNQPG